MAVTAVFFDVGETLVDEERVWREVAVAAGLRPHVVWAALGTTIERGEEHWELWRRLDTERPPEAWTTIGYERGDLFPDAIPCLEAMRAAGRLVGIAGNQSAEMEEWARSVGLPVDVVTSSAGLGARKPEPAFFARLVELSAREPEEVAYVGDRVDNDVLPALEAGLVAVHVRRGPWGLLQPTPEGVPAIDALSELGPVLDRLASDPR
ncbi:MAG TPA: HAD family hydrolase [Gaiella sp.]|nr:HAD family hydrolase [Gaiella sp.]